MRRGAELPKLKSEFSSYLQEIERRQFELYREAEQQAWDDLVGTGPHVLRGRFDEVYGLVNSIAQSRRSRAGSAFEDVIKQLFRHLGYPYEEQAVVDGKPDFILPSADHYRRHASDTIIFTCKRTLRERWRQIATEGTRGLAHFLGTIDDTLTPSLLAEMRENRIYLVVPKDKKDGRPPYAEAPNVISFEDFFEDHIDPAMRRWRKEGVIP
ncbi:MAG: type II restriction endonuclease [Thermoplasmata archaeon]